MERRVSTPDIAVIGAGMTGLVCASRLADAGFSVRVYDKSRGVGGRIATRRAGTGLCFDHGAPFVDAESPEMAVLLDRFATEGSAVMAASAVDREASAQGTQARRTFGLPGMSGLLRPLAERVTLHRESEVSGVVRDDRGWRLSFEDGRAPEGCDILICAVPAPQARVLLADVTDVAERLAAVEFDPCWTVMVGFAAAQAVDLRALRGSGELFAHVYRENDKPGREDLPMACWVLHAAADWSIRHLELDRPEAADRLLQALRSASNGSLPDPQFLAAHRWRYARTRRALGSPYASNAESTLFVGGDWCLGDSVDHAFRSGTAMAEAIVDRDAAHGLR